MTYLVVSCSLNPASYSRVLADLAVSHFLERGEKAELADLCDYELPFASGEDLSKVGQGHVSELHDRVEASHAMILVAPTYNYGVSASCRNFIELTGSPHGETLSGSGWYRKVVGLITVAASPKSKMAPLDLLNGLLLWHRCVIVPSFVSASHEDYEGRDPSECLVKEVHSLVDDTCLFSDRLISYFNN